MSFGRVYWELGRRAAACLAIAIAVPAAAAPGASADSTFGGNPDQEVIPEITSEISCAPFTCTLFWGGAAANDLAPIPPSGGSGTVTSVTLPPLLDPGPMQAVVLTSTTEATRDPAHPKITCCTVKELSPPFTVPPGQVTTVPLSLHVSATAAANLDKPGDTSTADGVGISVIEAEASAPIHATENAADHTRIWAPALTAPSTTTADPIVEREGYELEARFTYLETPGGGKPGTPGGGSGGPPGSGPGATSGLALRRGPLRPGRDGRTLILGTATNPPTASTKQTLTATVARLSGGRSKSKQPVVIGRGKTKVADGKKAPLKLVLNGRGRAALARLHGLKANLRILALNPEGEDEALVRNVRIEAPASRPKRSR